MQTLASPAALHAPATRDQRLWQIAKRRTKFQDHLLVYLLVNAGLWVVYYLVPASQDARELPWPLWTSLFWGLAVGLQGAAAYSGLNRGERIQREYERLASTGG